MKDIIMCENRSFTETMRMWKANNPSPIRTATAAANLSRC